MTITWSPTTPAVAPPLSSRSGSVDIVTGSFGAGHDAAARAIAAQLSALGVRTRTWDVVDLMPGRLGRAIRSGYLRQVQSAPASWRWLLMWLEHSDRAIGSVRSALESTAHALLDVTAGGPDAVVSTHPLASQALGALRGRHLLDVPVTTYLTDMSVHRLWVHPMVDAHLAIHDIPARQALTLGARSSDIVVPAVDARFTAGHDAVAGQRARRRLGIPDGRLALVTGGSCGIGRLHRAATELHATGLVTPVVLCGSNDRLRERVTASGLHALGWVEDMPGLLSGVDVVVQNAGGMTALETAAVGVPMITYRCIAGHGETNAAALDAAGTAHWVRSPAELPAALRRALRPRPERVGPRAYESVARHLIGHYALSA